MHKIQIGNNTILFHENMLIPTEKKEIKKEILNIYLHWPDMNGYNTIDKDDFYYPNRRKRIIFLTLKKNEPWHNINKRFEHFYQKILEKEAKKGPGGLNAYSFKDPTYKDEEILIQDSPKKEKFIARCFKQEIANNLITGCQRDILINQTLTLSYKFPRALLSQWPHLEAAIIEKTHKLILKE